MGALQQRLTWRAHGGAVFDGQRRYLLMRPDVLMGALPRLDAAARAQWLAAVAASAAEHGAQSLAAYAAAVGDDAEALLASTIDAAADLGWGRWRISREGEVLVLDVADSPFAAGWRACAPGPCDGAVCAPIRGLFTALAARVEGAAVVVDERRCVAADATAGSCRFTARRLA
jgi:predicted hydrocarbon binding protein